MESQAVFQAKTQAKFVLLNRVPEDEDEPDGLQLQVVVLQEDDLVVQVPRHGDERGVDGPPELRLSQLILVLAVLAFL